MSWVNKGGEEGYFWETKKEGLNGEECQNPDATKMNEKKRYFSN